MALTQCNALTGHHLNVGFEYLRPAATAVDMADLFSKTLQAFTHANVVLNATATSFEVKPYGCSADDYGPNIAHWQFTLTGSSIEARAVFKATDGSPGSSQTPTFPIHAINAPQHGGDIGYRLCINPLTGEWWTYSWEVGHAQQNSSVTVATTIRRVPADLRTDHCAFYGLDRGNRGELSGLSIPWIRGLNDEVSNDWLALVSPLGVYAPGALDQFAQDVSTNRITRMATEVWPVHDGSGNSLALFGTANGILALKKNGYTIDSLTELPGYIVINDFMALFAPKDGTFNAFPIA